MTVDEAYALGDITARTLELCYQVKVGAKPAAQLGVPREYLHRVKEIITEAGCKSEIINVAGDRVSVDIYLADHVLLVLQTLDQLRGQVSDTFIHWCAGKIYGYSEDCIAGYIREQGIGLPPEAHATSVSYAAATVHHDSGTEDWSTAQTDCPRCKSRYSSKRYAGTVRSQDI